MTPSLVLPDGSATRINIYYIKDASRPPGIKKSLHGAPPLYVVSLRKARNGLRPPGGFATRISYPTRSQPPLREVEKPAKKPESFKRRIPVTARGTG